LKARIPLRTVELLILVLLVIAGFMVFQRTLQSPVLSGMLEQRICNDGTYLGVGGDGVNLTYSVNYQLVSPHWSGEARLSYANEEWVTAIFWRKGFPCNDSRVMISVAVLRQGKPIRVSSGVYPVDSQALIALLGPDGVVIKRPESLNLPADAKIRVYNAEASTPYGVRPVTVIVYEYTSAGERIVREYHYDQSSGILVKFVETKGEEMQTRVIAELRGMSVITDDTSYSRPAEMIALTGIAGVASGTSIVWLLYSIASKPK